MISSSSSSSSTPGRAKTIFGACPCWGLVANMARSLEAPFAVAQFPGVGDVAGAQRQAIQYGRASRVRVVAADLDVDAPDAIAVPFLDFVDQVELARLLEEARLGLDVGEDVADLAVLVLHAGNVLGQLRLIEEVAARELEILGQLLGFRAWLLPMTETLLTTYRGPFVDDEVQRHPALLFVVDPFATDAGAEEAQTAVIVGQAAYDPR